MAFANLWGSPAAQSFGFGLLSAVSLPLGAAIGVRWRPPRRVLAAILAFGAGSLLAALTLELVVPAFEKGNFWPLALGSSLGGALFVTLNAVLNSKGGFLRKPATLVRHIMRLKRAQMKNLVEPLSQVDILRALPPEEIRALLPYVNRRRFPPETVIFRQGDVGDSLYLITKGEVEVIRDDEAVATLSDGDSFGEMSLLSGEPRNATLETRSPLEAWEILKDDFDHLLDRSPRLRDAVENLSETRRAENRRNEAWTEAVREQVDDVPPLVTDEDLHEATRDSGNAAFAIWLGILLDGIPESAVIGASLVESEVSWALIAGLFLANLPESLSSAVSMRARKTGVGRILLMWTSLMVMTGIGAVLGNLFFVGASHHVFALFEGLAAGAMLVMVAETMLPEAYEQGDTVVGMSCLFGFLAALFVKFLH